MISPAQCRGARAMLGLSTIDLAHAAQVGQATINRFERSESSSNPATLMAIQRALEALGVEFLPDNGVRVIVAQVAPVTRGGSPDPGSSSKPATDKLSPASRPRKPAPERKAAAMSKEAQIRALRERSG